MSTKERQRRLTRAGQTLVLLAVLLASCSTAGVDDACAPLVEELMPMAQDILDAIDASDLEALTLAQESLATLEKTAIDVRCPADTLAALVSDDIESLNATTEAGQEALDDLKTNGPYVYELPDEPRAESTTTVEPSTSTAPSTTVAPTTTMAPTTTAPTPTTTPTTEVSAPPPPISLCDIEDGGALEEILGSPPGPGRIVTSSSSGVDACVWEVDGVALVGVSILPAGTVLPDDSKALLADFGIAATGYATSGQSFRSPAEGSIALVFYALAEIRDVKDSYVKLLDNLESLSG